MPAGLSDDALDLANVGLLSRTMQVRLHTDDPGDAGTSNAVAPGTNGYQHQALAAGVGGSGGWVQEVSGRYSNRADVDFGSASGGTWGTIGWATVWYDADAPAGTGYDTLLATYELATAQTVADTDPFVLRAGTMDVTFGNTAA